MAVSMTAILRIHSCHAWRKTSAPTGDNAFLHELEFTVRAKLTLAETSRSVRRAPAAGLGSSTDAIAALRGRPFSCQSSLQGADL
jgi:hypothetical protein